MSNRSSNPGGGTGSCLCGNVSYVVDGSMRQIVACHCQQCRKQSGHFFAATDASDCDLTIKDDGSLKWYVASETAKRGFCSNCGSILFWKANGHNRTSILAGSLDTHPGLKLDRHIFCDDKGDYYELNDGLPVFGQAD